MEEIIIQVDGQPKTWTNNEHEWRKKLYDECKNYEKDNKIILDNFKDIKKFSVKITFYIKFSNRNEGNGPDLDNLAKPVLDTIFKIKKPQGNFKELNYGMIKCDDYTVYELILDKVITEDKEGAKIKIKGYNN